MITDSCNICPRRCGVDRINTFGFCGAGVKPEAALYMLHRYEEPFISGRPNGTRGSGTVFFKGCPLKCVYCQNRKISLSPRLSGGDAPSNGSQGETASANEESLADIFLKLQAQGAYNINLVTPTHFTVPIIEAVKEAKAKGLNIPIVWNTSGYELPETIGLLRDTVDIYLTDFKYYKAEAAQRYSGAPDYFKVAAAALETMVKQQPKLVYGEDGMLKRGVVVRYLALPGLLSDGCRILEYLYGKYGDTVFISIMNQYTPQSACDFERYPELKDKTPQRQYNKLVRFAQALGITNAFTQSGGTVSESFIPKF